MAAGPHLAVAPALAGAPLGDAPVAAVLVHGRGQDPGYMVEHLVDELGVPGVSYVLPVAVGNSWYPDRYTAPRAANEPWLSHALEACDAAVQRVVAAGVPAERIVLAGFSQGGCLVADLVARRPRPYAGVAVLTGALVGPAGDVTPVAWLDGLPVFMATSRYDEWVALDRVQQTARAFAAAGADVTLRVSADREHRIGQDAVAGVRDLLVRAGAPGSGERGTTGQ
jgi:phospholipase/carboxylesterase